MSTILRTSVLVSLFLLAACPAPAKPQPPAPPPVEVTGGPGVVFSGWRLEGTELVGDLRLEGDWEMSELEIATVPLDAASAELARATFQVPTPTTGHTQTVRIPMPEGAVRVKIEVTRTSLVSCDNTVDHVLGLVKAQYADQISEEELAEARNQGLSECTDQAWSKDYMACMLKADELRTISECETAYGPTDEALAAKEERPGCLDIGKRRTELARKAVDTDTMDPESKEFFDRMLASNERQLVKDCVAESWSDEVLVCMKDANNAAAVEKCRPAGSSTGAAHNPMAGRSACQTTAEHLGKLIKAEMAASMPPAPGAPPPPPPPLKQGQSAEDPDVVAAQEAYDQAVAEHQAAVEDYEYRKAEQAYFVSDSISRFAYMCTEEKWSKEARSCIQRAGSVGQLGPCEEMLYGDDE